MRVRRVSLVPGVARMIAFSLCCLGTAAIAQSTDISAPAAVRTNEVVGTIAARDIGDSRLTDHYYVFIGRPGDVLITVDSRNLNGDVDVFTTTGLRPLLKLSVYAGNSSPVTKSIYLRKQENLILRIEGRSPNDDEGSYRLYFGGSFEPITTDPLVAENERGTIEPASPDVRSGKKLRRVSSVGARVEEPPVIEVAAAPTPEFHPVEPAKADKTKTEASKSESGRAEVPKATVARAPARTPRGRRLPGRRAPAAVAPKDEPAKSETEATAENTKDNLKPPATRKRPVGRNTSPRTVAKSTAPVEPQPESGPRLIIETSDGTLINRYMSGVRRVVVENGQVVVAGKDGKIERIPLANILRMSIAP